MNTRKKEISPINITDDPSLEANILFSLPRLVGATEQNGEGLWIVDKDKIVKTPDDKRLFFIRSTIDFGGSYGFDLSQITLYFELKYLKHL